MGILGWSSIKDIYYVIFYSPDQRFPFVFEIQEVLDKNVTQSFNRGEFSLYLVT